MAYPPCLFLYISQIPLPIYALYSSTSSPFLHYLSSSVYISLSLTPTLLCFYKFLSYSFAYSVHRSLTLRVDIALGCVPLYRSSLPFLSFPLHLSNSSPKLCIIFFHLFPLFTLLLFFCESLSLIPTL